MTEVKTSKKTQTSGGGESAVEDLIPGDCSAELKRQILAEQDAEKRTTLIQLAWDETGAAKEPEFLPQSKRKAPKPKTSITNSPSNGSSPHPRRGGGGGSNVNGSRPTSDKKLSGGRSGSNPKTGSTNPANTGAQGGDIGKNITTAPNKPAASQGAATVAPTNTAQAPVAPAVKKAAPAAAAAPPSQSAWASGKPLSQKLSAKPEEEKREKDEKMRAELAAQEQAKAHAEEEKKRKEAAERQQQVVTQKSVPSAPETKLEESAPASAAGMSYLQRAKGVEIKRRAPQQAKSQGGEAEVLAPQAATSATSAQSQDQVRSPPIPSQPAFEAKAPVVLPSVEKSSKLNIPATTVRVPHGFGSAGIDLNFGEFGAEPTNTSVKYPSSTAPASWNEDKKSNDAAANSAFISNLMAGNSASSTASPLVANAPSVKDVESQLMSTANQSSSSAPEPIVSETSVSIPASPGVAPSNVNAPASIPVPTSTSSNPLMMGASFQRPPSNNNAQMNAPMQNKKGGRSAGVPSVRGNTLASGLRHPQSYVDPYYYQPDHSQAGFLPYPQGPTFATDPQMFTAAAQYGYGNEMSFYAQQQQQQQQQATASNGAPPGLGSVNVSSTSQTPSGEYSTSQSASDHAASSVSGSSSSSNQQQHLPTQQQGYFAQQYSYGQQGLSPQHHTQQQGTQQQQLAGAGSVAGTSQQQDSAAFPASHPSSYSGAASYAPPNMNMYPYYGYQNYYGQYPGYPTPTTRYASGFPPVPYGQAPLPQQDQQRQASTNAQYYGQNLSSAASTGPAGATSEGASIRGGPPGYGASYSGAQQQSQQPQHPSSGEASWASQAQPQQQQQQPENYQYRSASNFYAANASGSSGQEAWRRQ